MHQRVVNKPDTTGIPKQDVFYFIQLMIYLPLLLYDSNFYSDSGERQLIESYSKVIRC